ncbi:MAG TPA: hypothetical protein VNA11_02150 [Pseudonocardia sp.]|jgi:hypothetical protein|nr:hypothetical protein [Pseudonocardia sp.]
MTTFWTAGWIVVAGLVLLVLLLPAVLRPARRLAAARKAFQTALTTRLTTLRALMGGLSDRKPRGGAA